MSLPQIDDARMATSTCPWPGRGTGTSTIRTVRSPGRTTPRIGATPNTPRQGYPTRARNPCRMPAVLARHYRSGVPVEVVWEGGRITAAAPADPAAGRPDAWIAPGLLDIQVNGYAGLDFSRPEHLRRIAAALAAHGVARFCPTVITAAPEIMEAALASIASALDTDAVLRDAVPGIHVEGPYISDLDGPRGAHPRAYVRDPDWAHFERLRRAAGGYIKIVTLAPERPGSEAFIARVTADGILVAIGHTAADGEAVRRAVNAGARLSTHLGNGLAATIDRHRNPLWPQLASRPLAASFIADGHHLPPDALAAMMAAKGAERCVLVSDAVLHAGLPPGRYPGIGGGEVEVFASGRVQLAGTPYLAGSGAHLAHCVAHAAAVGAASLPDALDMAGLHPAHLLGLPTPALEPGAPADLLVYRRGTGPALQVLATVRAGEIVHGRPPAL